MASPSVLEGTPRKNPQSPREKGTECELHCGKWPCFYPSCPTGAEGPEAYRLGDRRGQASEWLKVQTPAQPPTQSIEHPEGRCSKHSVQMHQNHKAGRSWWSHRTAAGWCQGK